MGHLGFEKKKKERFIASKPLSSEVGLQGVLL